MESLVNDAKKYCGSDKVCCTQLAHHILNQEIFNAQDNTVRCFVVNASNVYLFYCPYCGTKIEEVK